MQQNPHLDAMNEERERPEPPRQTLPDDATLRAHAAELARTLPWLPGERSSGAFLDRCRKAANVLRPLLRKLTAPLPAAPASAEYRWLHDGVRLIATDLQNAAESFKTVEKMPHVRAADGAVIPRSLALAAGFCAATSCQFSPAALVTYLEAFQEQTVLKMGELWALVPSLKLALLEEIGLRGTRLMSDRQGSYGIGACVRSLREIGQTSWKDLLEPLIAFDQILRQDPAGQYSRMDYDSRNLYRSRLVTIADHSDFNELQVAAAALALARDTQKESVPDPRAALRRAHIGYYLLEEGSDQLHERVGYRPSLGARIASALRRHPNEFFLPGIEILTFAITLVILLPLVGQGSSFALIVVSLLLLILPCSQSAVQVMNYLTTAVLTPQILPKIDFSGGIPEDCITLVAVPTILMNREQVQRLVDALEVRYLGNHDPNIHFALVTDLPDAREHPSEEDPLVDFCTGLIQQLNGKYGRDGQGSFLLLHRHRVYNPRERIWMGWERKRGKLLDLNKLLRQQYDSFPVKIGDLSILPRVRFVLTLDSDTELPRGSAHRMIGAMAHPLNQAIIDQEKNIVTAGYGILQPRVGVSVHSASRSRLAAIYSGETGFDIYSRAISDVYQDLYGEGIFTGKGIYEVDTVYQVLERRFPRNALLSHDLIEGAYARAGLASDIEIIEDYPSHYSAHNRRKHRWLRGDWQIAGWLLSRVPDESGKRVKNPISIVSQWKIVDNLRRSLVEPGIFLLLVLGWLGLPGTPRYWTLATLAILFVPVWFQLIFGLVRAAVEKKQGKARLVFAAFLTSNVNLFFTLTFLAHQMLVSLDAVARVLVRRVFTRQRLLEWETAAEAEIGSEKRTPIDTYLNWTPVIALVLGAQIWFFRHSAFLSAVPILALWMLSKLVSVWLNRPPSARRAQASDRDEIFLRRSALKTWRYFAEFSTAEHNWLIPDNLQMEPFCIAARVSPTNIGLLLNARQVACEFGYLTVDEFAEQTLRTLATVSALQKVHGHLLNWYDTRTLTPLPPAFVSSVDSGNLLASLWTLQQGVLQRLRQPVSHAWLAEGMLDFLDVLAGHKAFPRKRRSALSREVQRGNWLKPILELPETAFDERQKRSAAGKDAADVDWFRTEALARLRGVRQTIRSFTPWLLPEFETLRTDPALQLGPTVDSLALNQLPDFIDKLAAKLRSSETLAADTTEDTSLLTALQSLLPAARANSVQLMEDLRAIAATAGRLANEMDFSFLLNEQRKMMSVGYEVDRQELNPACYDLLATESRTAVFVAIAKEDIPQESWFLLGRAHTVDYGLPVLLSWTGTMFEYLMPSLWMRTYPNTLIERSRNAAVRSQKAYAAKMQIPWGISESAYSLRDESGNYQYHAFGIPSLALRQQDVDALVVSPYSSFLALSEDAPAAIENLRRMLRYGWSGSYGFYEAIDFTPANKSWRREYEVVHCWMAHHQGMSLLAIANFLRDDAVQKWFHADRRVQATELLLHERPVSHVQRASRQFGRVAA